MLPAALYAKLNAEPAIAERLAKWDFGSGTYSPAIFTTDPIPDECGHPAIIITQDGGGEWGDRGHRGQDVIGSIVVWGEKYGSDRGLIALAQLIWSTLNKAALTLSSFDECGVDLDPPQRIVDDLGYPGYLLNWRIAIIESLT